MIEKMICMILKQTKVVMEVIINDKIVQNKFDTNLKSSNSEEQEVELNYRVKFSSDKNSITHHDKCLKEESKVFLLSHEESKSDGLVQKDIISNQDYNTHPENEQYLDLIPNESNRDSIKHQPNNVLYYKDNIGYEATDIYNINDQKYVLNI